MLRHIGAFSFFLNGSYEARSGLFWVGLTQPPSTPWDVSPLAIFFINMGRCRLFATITKNGGGWPPSFKLINILFLFYLKFSVNLIFGGLELL